MNQLDHVLDAIGKRFAVDKPKHTGGFTIARKATVGGLFTRDTPAPLDEGGLDAEAVRVVCLMVGRWVVATGVSGEPQG